MKLYRVTGRKPLGHRFVSSPRSEAKAQELATNLRAAASDRRAKIIAKKSGQPVATRAERGLQSDIRVEPAEDGAEEWAV